MKLKSITLTSKNNAILYKVACHAYSMSQFSVKKIVIINKNKAKIYYVPFVVRMKR